jgi:radical SAM superfamily enzyme YgiQ (UPF0313 family)
MQVLLISTYDLGRQPFGLASPAAFLRRAGHTVGCADLTRTRLPEDVLRGAGLVAFYLPMHTATRLAMPVIDRVRALNPSAHLCAYGLYAPLNAALLRERGVQTILGPEFETDLIRLVDSRSLDSSRLQAGDPVDPRNPRDLPRIPFIQPDRADLPPLTKYASLQTGAHRKVVGYTEATRGCKHRCRHCPIVPVYDGRFRAVAADVVLADIRGQVAAGAEHITFGDPDFFNGPVHAVAIVNALARECPGVSYDATIKVEHLRKHADLLPVLRETGCAFVTTAVESFEDAVLDKLRKGHTHADFEAVVVDCAAIGLPLSPTFVAFTPWTTLEGYVTMLREIDRLALTGSVAPIQYAIRLLIPDGSLMLELEDVRARITHFDPRSLTNVWRHADPRVDALQQAIERFIGSRLNAPRDEVFARVWTLAHEAAGLATPSREPLLARAAVPYLNEPWYC